jgi:positive phototaxis protein PixI
MSVQQQFLRFQLQSSLMALIEIDLVTELVNMPIDRIVPMPHLPPAVMGVYNWRGEILWVVDLAILLGMNSCFRQKRSLQPTIILTSEAKNEDRQQKTVGFVVDEIAEIEWFDLDLLQSPLPPGIYPECSSWASGLLLSTTGEKFLKLDGKTIFDSTSLNADI